MFQEIDRGAIPQDTIIMSPHKNVGAMSVAFINKHDTSSMEVGKELSFGIEIKDIMGLEINASKVVCRASFVNHQEFVTDFVDSDEHGTFRINSFQECHIEKLSHKYVEDLNMTQLLLIICVNTWKPTTEGPQMISTSSREIIESMKCERDIAETNGDEVLLAKRILNYKEQNKNLKLDLANMKKTWEVSVEKMHKEHDKAVSENKIAMHKLTSNFKTQMEKQVVDAKKNVERKQQQQIKVLTTKIESLNQQHNQEIAFLEKEKQQLANKATIEVKSLQEAHSDLMQQHQSEVRHLLSQHKNELEESIKMRDAEILKVREELAEERKRHSIELKEANDDFLRKENIYKRDVKQKQEKRSELLNEEFEKKLREGKLKFKTKYQIIEGSMNENLQK